jgi:Nif-specific regulatory protein
MEKVYAIIERVASNSSNVFVNGETGTGKEVVGRLLHDKSPRRERPLVRAYVSACPLAEQESYLFGDQSRPGCLKLAEEGTLYIDEVGILSLEVQALLFDAITSGKLTCRLVAASDMNLLEKIESGQFRKDLFYSLNVVPIYLPPLRDRTQDIEPLADHFIKIFAKKFSKTLSHLDEEALFLLIQYSWPGNIRELENCMEYAANVADGPVIKKQHLPPHLANPALAPKLPQRSKDAMTLRVQGLERVAIEEALRSSGGDLLKAAQKLGVPPSLLEEKAVALKVSGIHL